MVSPGDPPSAIFEKPLSYAYTAPETGLLPPNSASSNHFQ